MTKKPQNCGTSICSCIECVIDKRQWISLTNEDRLVIDNEYINELGSVEHFKAVEEKLKELNQ